MFKALVSWVGNTDLRASRGEVDAGVGPVGQAVEKLKLDEINLLSNYPAPELGKYQKWLRRKTECKIVAHSVRLSGPTNFSEIYEAAARVITEVLTRHGPERTHLTFHLSPGTPAMAAVFVILSKTRFNADLIQTSKERGLEYASVPFEFSAFVPDLLRRPDEELERLSAGVPPEAPEFDQIIRSRTSVMNGVIAKARLVAPHKVPVLIEGESGTGKEMLSRAVHNASPRRDKPFVAVNCGAIPEQLVESELFGHRKGAFTGATEHRAGHFMEANGGTIFLDEVGELPLATQVKLAKHLLSASADHFDIDEMSPSQVGSLWAWAARARRVLDEVESGLKAYIDHEPVPHPDGVSEIARVETARESIDGRAAVPVLEAYLGPAAGEVIEPSVSKTRLEKFVRAEAPTSRDAKDILRQVMAGLRGAGAIKETVCINYRTRPLRKAGAHLTKAGEAVWAPTDST